MSMGNSKERIWSTNSNIGYMWHIGICLSYTQIMHTLLRTHSTTHFITFGSKQYNSFSNFIYVTKLIIWPRNYTWKTKCDNSIHVVSSKRPQNIVNEAQRYSKYKTNFTRTFCQTLGVHNEILLSKNSQMQQQPNKIERFD